MQLTGIHHLTAVTADVQLNYRFYTEVLGLRLVKKTVNQDDVSAYHIFYADGEGSPGTDITFFDWPVPAEKRGTNSIVRTGFRIASEDSLAWWHDRFKENGVIHSEPSKRDGRSILDFEDPEGQRLSLIVDPQGHPGSLWEKSPVPSQHQIQGLGPITMSVPKISPTDTILKQVLSFRQTRSYQKASSNGDGTESVTVQVYEMGQGGPAAELHVAIEPNLPAARAGAGSVHHVAFRTPNQSEYQAWNQRLQEMRMPSSGPVDRFYFRSLYFREPNGILFEIATDEPGFDADEPMETLGEGLALPPFLEDRRAAIEARLKPLETSLR